MIHLFDKVGTIYRHKEVYDEYNTPIGEDWAIIGNVPCRLTRRKDFGAKQRDPQSTIENFYTIYFEADVNIKAGDVVEIDGLKYRLGEPYKPNYHHQEVSATYKGEV